MAEFARNETGGLVTVHAVASRRHMIGRWDLSSGGVSVMAQGAVPGDARVIERRAGKGGGVVTRGTVLRRPDGDMVEMRAGCPDTIMAGGTVVDDAGMIEHCGRKGATGYVADSAILVGDEVWRIDFGVFADGVDSVVA